MRSRGPALRPVFPARGPRPRATSLVRLIVAASLAAVLLLAPTPSGATTPEAVRFFDQSVANILATESATRRVELFEALLASRPQSPVVRADGSGVVFWVGEASRVELIGDMTDWRQPLPLTRVADTPLWTLEARLHREARLDYALLVDGEEIVDPLNPERVQARGERRWSSVWRGPKAPIHPAFAPSFSSYPSGANRTITVDGRQVHLHIPAMARLDRARKFPLVVCLNGQSARDAMRLGDALDRLVAHGDVAPVLLAMAELDRPIEANAAVDAEQAAWVADRLLPRLEEALPAKGEPSARLVIGMGWSGALAYRATLERPGVFGHAAAFSAPAGGESDVLAKGFSAAKPKPGASYHLLVGSFETLVGGHDLRGENQSLRSAMAGAGVECRFVERPAGHSYGFWRDEAADLFGRVFPAEKRGTGIVQLTNPELPKR